MDGKTNGSELNGYKYFAKKIYHLFLGESSSDFLR
jgi:hypothetical protein